MPVVERAVAGGIPVVITSRCPTGRVEPIYGKGGGKDLADAGAIFAGDLRGPKARLLLMVLAAPQTKRASWRSSPSSRPDRRRLAGRR